MDIILKSKVGHILIAFVRINENGSKFPQSELSPANFKNYIAKLIQLQEKVFPEGKFGNNQLDFMGCTANICYI